MNIGRLFLDVQGTITSKSYYNYATEIERSKILLKKLIAKDNIDELRISIVSSECIEDVEKIAEHLEQRLEGIDKIHFGHHHADSKMMHIGGIIREDKKNKCEQMIANLGVCNHIICYYADDCNINRIIARAEIQHFYPNMKLVIFNPKDEALLGLNDEVQKYLKNI